MRKSNPIFKQKVSKYEQSMKEKFVEIMNNPNTKYADCLDYIQNEIDQSRKMANLQYSIPCFRNDGVYQLNQAISEVFGSTTSKENDNPSGDSNVSTVDITLADGTRIKAPFGDISLSGLGDDSYININYDYDKHTLEVTGKCQFKFSSLMDDIIEVTKRNISQNSIYKGQALEITDINEPKILNLDNIDNQLLILSDKTKYDLKPIRARLLNPQKCLDKGVPLKYGALLSGNYGTGKTLVAFKLAKLAVDNGWIFIYLKDPKLLAESLRMSKIIDKSGYGVVIFTEDIDQVIRGNRDAAMQDILNTLDGGDTKDMNVISLFTTNHIELIEPTFLRGKRISSIIEMGALDAKTAEEFIRASFESGCYTIQDDLTEVCQYIEKANIVPAFMADIIERVKAMMILSDQCFVDPKEIKYSVDSYMHHVELSKIKDLSITPEKQFVDSLRQILDTDKDDARIKGILEMTGVHMDEDPDDYLPSAYKIR
jgi:transitional endoplasmic reticulum ATPase